MLPHERQWPGDSERTCAGPPAADLAEQPAVQPASAPPVLRLRGITKRFGAMVANEFIRMPYLFSQRRPPGAARWGLAHKQFQRRY